MKRLSIMLSFLLLTGCAGWAGKPSPIMEVGNAEQVKDCHLLKSFTAPPSYRIWGTPYIGNFKNEVIQEAEKIGATHMWSRSDVDGIASTGIINVYKCPIDLEAPTNEEREEEYY